ncbi:MAG: hypothetical protein ACJ71T_14185 [Actinomycetales bacterium]
MAWSGPNTPYDDEGYAVGGSEPEAAYPEPAGGAAPDPEVYALAYTASVEALKQQDTTLGNLRTRASAMLATAALGTSFAAGLGLFSTDTTKGRTISAPYAWTIFGNLVLIGALTFYCLWPVKNWAYGPDARLLLQATDEDGMNKASTQKNFAERLTECRTTNAQTLRWRYAAYELSVVLLVTDVGLLILALT